MKPINSTTTLSSFLPFLLLMHLCIMHNELYSPRKESERLPGRIPSLFAKMINLAPQTEHSPYSVGFIAPVCLSKQAVWCLSSEWSKRQDELLWGRAKERRLPPFPFCTDCSFILLLWLLQTGQLTSIARWNMTGDSPGIYVYQKCFIELERSQLWVRTTFYRVSAILYLE